MSKWFEKLPQRLLAIDCETTGLADFDRIVSIALISVETQFLDQPEFPWRGAHLIFDPTRQSHWAAKKVHGYSDWDLRYQDPFSLFAPLIHKYIAAHNLIIGHNVGFDLRFTMREFALCGLPTLDKPTFCTMQAWRDTMPGRSSLGSVSTALGLHRSEGFHGAFEDAWLSLQAYFFFHGAKPLWQVPLQHPKAQILNLKPVPPKPRGSTPPRQEAQQVVPV